MLSDLRNADYNAVDGNVTSFTFPETISPEVTWQTSVFEKILDLYKADEFPANQDY